MLNKLAFVVIMINSFVCLNAQNTLVHDNIQYTVDKFVEGLNKRDTVVIKKLVDQNLGLLTVFHDGKKNIIAAETLEMLMKSLSKSKSKTYYQEQSECIIETNNVISTAWCKYVVYDGTKIVHCGVNAYQLYKTNKGWKIIQITDSRQNIDCKPLANE